MDDSGVLEVSQASSDYLRPYWDQVGVTIADRHVVDMTDGWDSEAPFYFVDNIHAALTKAQELAGDRLIEVAAGDVGSQMLAAGLVNEVRMDVAPVVFGSGKRYFGTGDGQHVLEDPNVVIQGNGVLHLRCQVRDSKPASS